MEWSLELEHRTPRCTYAIFKKEGNTAGEENTEKHLATFQFKQSNSNDHVHVLEDHEDWFQSNYIKAVKMLVYDGLN